MSCGGELAEPVADVPERLGQPGQLGRRRAVHSPGGLERSREEPGRLRVGVNGSRPLTGDTRVVACRLVTLSVEIVQRELGRLGLRRVSCPALHGGGKLPVQLPAAREWQPLVRPVTDQRVAEPEPAARPR